MLKQILSSRKDRHLVQSFLDRRDERAFCALYQRYTPALYQFTLRMVGWCAQDAEDVVQDTWVRAVERLAEFRWQSAFKTWLTAIAINRSRELPRHKARKSDDETQLVSISPYRIEHIDVERAKEGRLEMMKFEDWTMVMQGYYIFQAESYEEAVKIASTNPHLKLGGSVVLRELDRP